MKFFAGLAIFLFVAAFSPARAQSAADDQYIAIYGLIQQADTLAGSGRPQSALTQFILVQSELAKFQKYYPAWNPKIVNFRLNYVAGKIAGLKAQLPAPAPVAAAPTVPSPDVRAPNAPAPAVVDDLRGQVSALQAVNTTLQAKLKEALAAQPATIDARELVKAQEKISLLLKETSCSKPVSRRENPGRTA